MSRTAWESFIKDNKTEQQRIEATSAITNRLLRYGFENTNYSTEMKTLDELFSGLDVGESMRNGFEAMKTFIPRVPEEICERYSAVKSELYTSDPKTIVIGACGLSPLGITSALELDDITVYDTDLSEVIEYRKSLDINLPENYRMQKWDLLSKNTPKYDAAGNVTLIVEGLTFYLDNQSRHTLFQNLQKTAESIAPNNKYNFIFDFYIADVPARQRDTKVMENHPRWNDFLKVVSNVHESQKAFFKSRDEVCEYLSSEGFSNPKASRYSTMKNAHTIFTCEYRVDEK